MVRRLDIIVFRTDNQVVQLGFSAVMQPQSTEPVEINLSGIRRYGLAGRGNRSGKCSTLRGFSFFQIVFSISFVHMN